MRSFLLVAALPFLMPLAACSAGSGPDTGPDAGPDAGPGIVGSGNGTVRTYPVSDFRAVELSGSDDVDVRVGTAFSVRAEGPAKELDRLKITRSGDSLSIGRINSDGNGFNWGSHPSVKVFVTMPRIVAAELAGSGDMTIDRADGDSFTGSAAGSGSLSIGALSVQKAVFSMAGSGDISAAGTARRLDVSIAGSGDVDAMKLVAESASVSIAGSGGVKAVVNGPAKVSVIGSGDVDLGPAAKCATSKMGSGEVRCG